MVIDFNYDKLALKNVNVSFAAIFVSWSRKNPNMGSRVELMVRSQQVKTWMLSGNACFSPGQQLQQLI